MRSLMHLAFGLAGLAFAASPSTSNAALPITNGLIGAYEFSGNAVDSSGNGSPLVVSGAALDVDRFGNANSAYRLDGIDDYLRTDSSTFDLAAAQYTVNVWVSFSSRRVGGNTVFNTDPHTGLMITVGDIYKNDPSRSNTSAYYVGDGNGGNWTVSGLYGSVGSRNDIGLNSWYMYSVIKNGGQWSFYINGVLDQTLTGAVPAGLTSSLTFGAQSFLESMQPIFGADYLAGSLDDISLYNRALGVGELGTLHQMAAPVPEPAEFLLMTASLPLVLYFARRRRFARS